jgi:aldose 1-epimerase
MQSSDLIPVEAHEQDAIRISFENSEAMVSLKGQALVALKLGDHTVMPRAMLGQKNYAGELLAPWPNRIRQGKYVFKGVEYQLPINEERGNALHGLVSEIKAKVSYQSQEALTLTTILEPQAYYPWKLEITTSYKIGQIGLEVRHTAKNLSGSAAPIGLGAHPYFDAPAGSQLLVKARKVARAEPDMIPVSYDPIQSVGLDSDKPVLIDGLSLDNQFIELEESSARSKATLIYADGSGFDLWQEGAKYLMVYTTNDFAWESGLGPAIAIEPQTCSADAFNNGQGLEVLAAGESFGFSWGVKPL